MSDTFTISQTGGASVVKLAPIMEMAASEEFLDVVRSCVVASDEVHFDASMVERLSTPCIQVIVACAMQMEKQGKNFRVVQPSQAFERGMGELGFKEYLDNWSKS